MDKFIVRGGKRLSGEVTISGAKNAAVAIIPAVIMAESPCRIENVPNISDVKLSARILTEMGAEVRWINRNTVEIDPTTIQTNVVPNELGRKMRGSYYNIGALLGRFSRAVVPLPGGCDLGARPIDQHIKGFNALGCTYTLNDGMIEVSADALRRPHLSRYGDGRRDDEYHPRSCQGQGHDDHRNAAREPHVVDLANFLNAMGAQISGAGTDVIKVRGVEHLKGHHVFDHSRPDRGRNVYGRRGGDRRRHPCEERHAEASRVDHGEAHGDGRHRDRIRRRGACAPGYPAAQVQRQDHAVSRLPDRHAATDRGGARARGGDEHPERERLGQPLPLCGRAQAHGRADHGGGQERDHRGASISSRARRSARSTCVQAPP